MNKPDTIEVALEADWLRFQAAIEDQMSRDPTHEVKLAMLEADARRARERLVNYRNHRVLDT